MLHGTAARPTQRMRFHHDMTNGLTGTTAAAGLVAMLVRGRLPTSRPCVTGRRCLEPLRIPVERCTLGAGPALISVGGASAGNGSGLGSGGALESLGPPASCTVGGALRT